VKWTYYYLYVLLDIFSRYVVGWLLARQESAALAKVLITQSCERQHITPDQLIIHADRGPLHDLPASGAAAGHPGRGAPARPAPRLQ
jgi:transposase InsO family protein